MLGMFGEEHDCTAQVENYRLDNAGDYMSLVSSGMTGLGEDGLPTVIIPGYPKKYGNYVLTTDGEKDDAGNTIYYYYNKYNGGKMSTKDVLDIVRYGASRNMSGLGCGENCDCPCNKNKISGLGEINEYVKSGYGAWPPGPEPTPYQWTAKDGSTWTRELIDGKWMYRWSTDPRLFVTVSNLYDMMGVQKDPGTLRAIGKVPGIPNEPMKPFDWQHWKIGGYGAGWVILGAAGLLAIIQGKK